MNGILIIDKPPGITSHDVVARVRRILKTKRVGHTGTLDPFATGVMVILIGQATRLAQFLDKDEKEYEALVRFGFETDTGDRTGNPMESPKSKVHGPRSVWVEDVKAVLNDFRGEITQIPPMYSAKKIDGKKLYEYARQGETVERKSINVKILELELLEGNGSENFGPETLDLGLRISCTAGTYIRTLAEDIGRKIGTGAHLAELRRTRAGKFSIEQSITLDDLSEFDDPLTVLRPMEDAVSHLQKLELTDERIAKTRNGLTTRIFDQQFTDGEAVRMQDNLGNLIAIGFYDEAETVVQPKVVLV